MKATHRGTCQCCESVQKLPGGFLANHGYRVVWNSFNGVCNGSREQPYERSCDLIQRYINNAASTRARIYEMMDQYGKPATEPKAWYHEYDSRHGASFWVLVDLLMSENRGAYYLKEGKKKWTFEHGSDLLMIATRLNHVRVTAWQQDIKKLDEYIARQELRINHWQLTELLPLEDKE